MPTYQILAAEPAVSSGDLRRLSAAPQPVKASVLGKVLAEAKTAPGGLVPKFRVIGTEYSAGCAIGAAESHNHEHGCVLVIKLVKGKKPAAVYFQCPMLGIEIRAD